MLNATDSLGPHSKTGPDGKAYVFVCCGDRDHPVVVRAGPSYGPFVLGYGECAANFSDWGGPPPLTATLPTAGGILDLAFPAEFRSSIVVVNIEGGMNGLRAIAPTLLCGLPSLRAAKLQYMPQLAALPSGLFCNNSNLEAAELQDLGITELDDGSLWSGLIGLGTITLRHNRQLRAIRRHAFLPPTGPRLDDVGRIYLESNPALQVVEQGAFDGLRHAELSASGTLPYRACEQATRAYDLLHLNDSRSATGASTTGASTTGASTTGASTSASSYEPHWKGTATISGGSSEAASYPTCEPCSSGSGGGSGGSSGSVFCGAGDSYDTLGRAHAPQVCEVGKYCDRFGISRSCQPGTYASQPGSSSCLACPAGTFCPVQSATPFDCGGPAFWCPDGIRQLRVDPGNYSVGGAAASEGTRATGQQRCEKGFYCTGGSRFTCPAGTYGASGGLDSNRCTGPCPVGTFCPSGSTQPQPCRNPAECREPGLAHDTTGNFLCPPGTEANAAVGTCDVCPVGTFKAGPGNATRCSSCSSGFFCPRAGSTEAARHACPDSPGVRCGGGSLFLRAGWWHNMTRWPSVNESTTFYQCPVDRHCQPGAAADCAQQCLLANGLAEMRVEWDDDDEEDGDDGNHPEQPRRPPVASSRRPAAAAAAIRCNTNASIIEGSLLCNSCEMGWVMTSGGCHHCESTRTRDIVFVVLTLLGLWLFSTCAIQFAMDKDQKDPSAEGFLLCTLKLILNYLISLSFLKAFRLDWGVLLQTIFQVSTTASSIPLTESFALCSTPGVDFLTLSAWVCASPFLYAAFIFFYVGLRWACHRVRDARRRATTPFVMLKGHHAAAFSRTAILLIWSYIFYPVVASVAFRVMACREIDGVRVLRMDYSIVCSGERYENFWSAAVAAIFVFLVGFPVAVATQLCRHRARGYGLGIGLDHAKARERYRWIYYGYKYRNPRAATFRADEVEEFVATRGLARRFRETVQISGLWFEYHNWELVFYARKLTLSFITVFYGSQPSLQLFLGLALTFSQLMLQMALQPFVHPVNGYLENLALFSTFITLFLAQLLDMADARPSYGLIIESVRTSVVLTIIATVVVLVVHVGLEIGKIVTKKKNSRRLTFTVETENELEVADERGLSGRSLQGGRSVGDESKTGGGAGGDEGSGGGGGSRGSVNIELPTTSSKRLLPTAAGSMLVLDNPMHSPTRKSARLSEDLSRDE